MARTLLGGTSDNIDVTGFANKRYLMVLMHGIGTGTVLDRYRLNGDTGGNYTWREETNGSADGTSINNSEGMLSTGASLASGGEMFTILNISNYPTLEKLAILQTVQNDTSGAAGIPDKGYAGAKHNQTSLPISQVNVVNTNSGDFLAGSECVVLGWDPSDDDTDGFWEELDSVVLNADNTTLNSNVFEPKKYLWVQYSGKGSSAQRPQTQFNGDTAANYSYRGALEGNADYTAGSQTKLEQTGDSAVGLDIPMFVNMFIMNNETSEKLVISQQGNSSVLGAGTPPSRSVEVGKWANALTQITSIQLPWASGDWRLGSTIKVWGHD